ncbi:nucleotidyltransferase family protein [Caedibacter taeniospiralis]|jgi:predicted nucleotidyltransferase|uniref:nucleotidyltransferase family protein n=1 Tax=Caedibacter taeniospiralis TaxID=28907 RepID=UPI0037BF6425
MLYGLSDETIAAIRTAISKQPNVQEAILYGSRVKGNYRAGSDIDLTLKGKNLTLTDLFSLEEALDDLYLPYTFDLSIYTELNHSELKAHIDRIGITFYSR